VKLIEKELDEKLHDSFVNQFLGQNTLIGFYEENVFEKTE